MVYSTQSIPNPCGVSVVGTHVIRVNPDRARLVFDVRRTHEDGATAMRDAQSVAAGIRALLAERGVDVADVRMSGLALNTAYDSYGPNATRLGERAVVSFDVVVSDVNTVYALTLALVEHGVDHFGGVSFHTSRLKQLRVDARRGAVEAARAKAEVYASAAGTALGRVIHIEDRDPSAHNERAAHAVHNSAATMGGGDDLDTYGPGVVTVVGVVSLTFALA